jgi:hypothetical protein
VKHCAQKSHAAAYIGGKNSSCFTSCLFRIYTHTHIYTDSHNLTHTYTQIHTTPSTHRYTDSHKPTRTHTVFQDMCRYILFCVCVCLYIYTLVPQYLQRIGSGLSWIPKSTDAQVHYIKWYNICI